MIFVFDYNDQEYENLLDSHNYSYYAITNKNRCKNIATAVEVVVGVIFIEKKYNINPIRQLIKEWTNFK